MARDSPNIASSAVVQALESGSWGYSKIEVFFCFYLFIYILLENISGATDCRLNFCWILIINVVSASFFLGKTKTVLMRVTDVAGSGGILPRLAFLAVCCLSFYIGARLLNIM